MRFDSLLWVEMTPSTTRGAVFSVAGSLVLLMTVTAFLSRAYVDTRSSRAEALYADGMRLANQGRHEEAAEDFRAALVYEHNSTKYRMALSRSLMALGHWDEAETHLLELREDDPTNGPVNLMLARVAAETHHDADAITDYQRAIYGYWPDHPTENRIAARFDMIKLLQADHEQRQVVAQLINLAADAPENDVATRHRVAALLLANGSPEHAAEIYRALLTTNRGDAAAQEGLGNTLFATGDFVGARNAYRAAEREGIHDNTLDERLKECERVLELDPTLVQLRAGERFERARQLLELATAGAQQCITLPTDLEQTAQKLEQEKAARRRDGDTVEMLTLAEQAWSLRHDAMSRNACAQPPTHDPALSAVLVKIQRQMASTQ